MKNKFFLLSLLLLCSTILSAETINGTCGTNLTWTLNTTDRTLTISGTGAMDNWTEGSTPWNAYLWAIGTVVIDSGTTSIGDYAFMGCNNLASVSISNGVTRIGNHAFHGILRTPDFRETSQHPKVYLVAVCFRSMRDRRLCPQEQHESGYSVSHFRFHRFRL